MKKILFQGINARYIHSNPALLYLKKYISDLPYIAVVSESSINEKPDEIIRSVAACQPDILALSVYIWNSGIVKKILPEIKKFLPALTVLLGGPEVSYSHDEWLRLYPEIDYIIAGAGEAAFRELALAGFEGGGKIRKAPNPRFSDIHFPYDGGEMKRLAGKLIYYESSRGCPFRCSYCLSSRSDQNLQFRDLSLVEDELDFFKYHAPALVKFVDRTFNSMREHYRPVWEYIVEKFSGGPTRFHFEIYPDLLDADDLDFLGKVPRGLFQFEMGIQSTGAETLAAINRGGRRAGWMDNIRSLAAMGNIHLHTDLIAGLPFETYGGFGESFSTVHSLGAEHFQCGFLKVLPGTEMRERAGEFGLGYSSSPPYEVEHSRWISPLEMRRLKEIAGLLDIFHNSGKFRESEKFLCGIYGTPFGFYEALSDLCVGGLPPQAGKWEWGASMLFKAAGLRGADITLVTDYLRWDWCSSAKLHHYPDMLKSEFTAEVKRKAFNYLLQYSERGRISFRGFLFTQDELRRSAFFKAASPAFRIGMMTSDYALFLPDKRVVEFDIQPDYPEMKSAEPDN